MSEANKDTPSKPVKPAREGAGGKVVVWTVLGLFGLVAVAYVAAYLGAGAKVPRGSTVAGVEIGGKSEADAASTLEKAMADRSEIDLTVEGKKMPVTAEDAGLTLDAEASVKEAGGGRSWAPDRLWDYYTGGDDRDPVVDVDVEAQDQVFQRIDDSFAIKPRNGRVSFVDGQVRTRDPRTGEELDREEAADALREGWLADEPVKLSMSKAEPEIGSDDVQTALDDFANPAVSGPVTLTFDGTPIKLSPAEFTPYVKLKPSNGELEPVLDKKGLGNLVRSKFADDGDAPVDATVRLVNGKPKVIAAKPGVTYRDADISKAFLALVVKDSGDRTMRVDSKVAQPKFTTKDARALKIKEKVSSFTTYYPYAEYRNVNIGRAAELVNGTVLKPNEIFSLNKTVGERTRENGFTEGFIISNGVFKEDLGGGVSQMATTTFNAMFFAGLEDIEHKPHSFYIDRYPVGREATVAWPTVDLSFRNDTDYGILIQSSIKRATPTSQGSVTVTMWSTKTWDITTKTGNRYAFTQPGTRKLQGPDCEPNVGYGGFDIDVWRYFRKPGQSQLERTEKFHTTYTPSDTVICKPEKAKTP